MNKEQEPNKPLTQSLEELIVDKTLFAIKDQPEHFKKGTPSWEQESILRNRRRHGRKGR